MTKKTGATQSRLAYLHELLVEQIIADFEFHKEENIPMSATDKQVAITLLRNEGITATPDNEDIQRLKDVATRIKDEAKKDVAMGIITEVQEAHELTAFLN
ncbi:putative DNA maturase subunit A [Acinetobacter phage Aristophanes]|uniref:Putative DNA maturase subunit A n=1 Tax=Acinetobacter phage Aristophanes TaxID=2759203 RepID=A0A7G9VYQ3_BPACA|nr:putative DNA maturase subunit A [Acinetobacter phage Aristophanes]